VPKYSQALNTFEELALNDNYELRLQHGTTYEQMFYDSDIVTYQRLAEKLGRQKEVLEPNSIEANPVPDIIRNNPNYVLIHSIINHNYYVNSMPSVERGK